ncbi:MAG: hypothetical protein M3Z09_03515 [Acidobacteriota bacterium]|nr:hypothetical protein [Acidobacteriota bacterium]
MAVLSLVAASVLSASSPAFWELSSYPEFLKGKFDRIALSRDGVLSVAPALNPLFPTGQAYLWSLGRTADGTIYAGTGNHGRLFRIGPDGKGAVIWTAPQPEIFAVAAGAGGVVYAGTSPNGRIYRIENGSIKNGRIENGAATEYFNPKTTYIWSLALGTDGALYAGTGGEGKIYRITAPGQGEEYFATGQANVTGLAFDASGALLAGSEPNGILYRITAKDKAFVLYDSNLPEIRAMASGADGSIYAAGLGGSVAKKTQSAAQGAAATVSETPTITTSITVTAEAAQNTAEIKPPGPEATKPPAVTATTTTTAAPAATVDLTGVEKSAIYQIHPDLTVETLWSSKEENVYDILPGPDGLLFATDLGRLYRLTANRRLTLVSQTGEGDLTRLFRDGSAVLAAAGSGGKIYRLGNSAAPMGGSYESPVFDAGSTSRWGGIRRGGSGAATLWTRSGNSLRPDRTWSGWAPVPANGAVPSPNARYLVWKAELAPNASVESVSVGYLPRNNAPLIRSITALTTMQPAAAAPKSSASAATSSYSITVTDTGDAGPSTSTGTAVQTLSRAGSQQLILSWQADDPDGDKLVFSVAFRGEGEREWKLLKQNLHENSLTLDAEALADGRYYFRVTASDREANAGASAREAELVSSPVLIDNTPPRVTAGPVHGRAFDFEAVDSASALKRAEYAIDGGAWVPVNPVSGILDSKQARFHVDLKDQSPGEHVVVVRAVDLANNSGQAKVVLP